MHLKELEDKIATLEEKVGRLEGLYQNLNVIIQEHLINKLPPHGGVPEPTQKAPKTVNARNNHKF